MWLVLYLGSPPVPEPRVLDDLPEARIRHARGRRRVEEPLDGLGSLRPLTRPAARKHRPEAEQCHIVLQHPALVAVAGEARALKDVSRLGVMSDSLQSVCMVISPSREAK